MKTYEPTWHKAVSTATDLVQEYGGERFVYPIEGAFILTDERMLVQDIPCTVVDIDPERGTIRFRAVSADIFALDTIAVQRQEFDSTRLNANSLTVSRGTLSKAGGVFPETCMSDF